MSLSEETILTLIREGCTVTISDKSVKIAPPKPVSTSAERVRRFREKKRNAETQCNDVTPVTHVTRNAVTEETPVTANAQFSVVTATLEGETLVTDIEIEGYGTFPRRISVESGDFQDFCQALEIDPYDLDASAIVGMSGPCYLTKKSGQVLLGFGMSG